MAISLSLSFVCIPVCAADDNDMISAVVTDERAQRQAVRAAAAGALTLPGPGGQASGRPPGRRHESGGTSGSSAFFFARRACDFYRHIRRHPDDAFLHYHGLLSRRHGKTGCIFASWLTILVSIFWRQCGKLVSILLIYFAKTSKFFFLALLRPRPGRCRIAPAFL